MRSEVRGNLKRTAPKNTVDCAGGRIVRCRVYAPRTMALTSGAKLGAHVANVGSTSADWLPDSRPLLFVAQGRVMVVDALAGGRPREVFSIPGEVIGRAVQVDSWLYVLSGTFTGDVWTIRFGEPGAGSPAK